MNEDTIKQEMEALRDIQARANELARELGKVPCKGIACDECPAQQFCFLVDNLEDILGADNDW